MLDLGWKNTKDIYLPARLPWDSDRDLESWFWATQGMRIVMEIVIIGEEGEDKNFSASWARTDPGAFED